MLKIWVDDVRPVPKDYILCRTTADTLELLRNLEPNTEVFLDLDHDAGDFAKYGGDYIEILNQLERLHMPIKPIIHVHSMNPVGKRNMIRIARHNGWEVL